jgi:hypothetical protein
LIYPRSLNNYFQSSIFKVSPRGKLSLNGRRMLFVLFIVYEERKKERKEERDRYRERERERERKKKRKKERK